MHPDGCNFYVRGWYKYMEKKVFLLGLISAIGSYIANLLGGWTSDLATLLIMMGIDFLMGLLIAAVWKRSGKSENGACQ
jgi:phage-related holin